MGVYYCFPSVSNINVFFLVNPKKDIPGKNTCLLALFCLTIVLFDTRKKGAVAFKKAGHLLIGFLCCFALLAALPTTPLFYTIFVMIGSLLPDIDHPTSTYGKYNPFTRWMKHRGHCHSIIGCALLSSPFLFFGLPIFLSVFYGAFFHLIGDRIYSMTSKKRRRFRVRLW